MKSLIEMEIQLFIFIDIITKARQQHILIKPENAYTELNINTSVRSSGHPMTTSIGHFELFPRRLWMNSYISASKPSSLSHFRTDYCLVAIICFQNQNICHKHAPTWLTLNAAWFTNLYQKKERERKAQKRFNMKPEGDVKIDSNAKFKLCSTMTLILGEGNSQTWGQAKRGWAGPRWE